MRNARHGAATPLRPHTSEPPNRRVTPPWSRMQLGRRLKSLNRAKATCLTRNVPLGVNNALLSPPPLCKRGTQLLIRPTLALATERATPAMVPQPRRCAPPCTFLCA